MFGFIVLLVTVIIILLIALLVFLRAPEKKISIYFSLMVFFGLTWLLSNYLENESFSLNFRILFLRIDFASAILLGLFFYLFCLNFPQLRVISLKKKIIIYTTALLLSILSFTNFIIKNIYLKDNTIQFSRGGGFLIYFFCMFFYIGAGCRDLISKYGSTTNRVERVQILYVFLGLLLTALIALPLNLILPQIIFISVETARIGIYSFLFFCIFTALAITRYHLFGIRVILTETLVTAIALVLLFQSLTAETLGGKIFGFVLLAAFAVMGYFLIRYTYLEIRRREEVEKISKAKSEFLSIASHQLRTPLSAIKGYLSMVVEGTYGGIPERAKKAIENVYLSNERLVKLVNAFLNITKIEMGGMEVNFEKESIEDLIFEAISELEIKAKEKNLYLKFEKPESPLPKISIDEEKIKEVILNLIDNAIKYTQKGGITIKTQIRNTKYEIRISDTGEGLTKEEQEKLFESFSRGTAGTRFWTEGVCLGLYVSRKFVELHKGKIWAESPGKGKGSTFIIELPIK